MNDKTLYDYWMICYRRRGSILVLVCTAIVGAIMIGASLPAIYEARAMFYVPASPTTQRSNTGDAAVPLPASNQDDAKANIGILKGRDALAAMHARFPMKSPDSLQRDVDFTAGRDGIIQIYVRDRDPKLAADVANAYAEYFNVFLANQMRQRTLPKIAALQSRIAEVDGQLRDTVRSRRELLNLSASTLSDVEALELFKGREDLAKELDELRGAIGARSPSESRGERTRASATPAIDELERQLAQIDIDLAKVRVQTLPDHPDQQVLIERRQAAQAALQQKLAALGTVDQARADTVAAMVERRNLRLKALPEYQSRLTEIDQQYRDLQAARTFLKNSLEEASLGASRSPVGIGIETAQVPQVPVFPILWLNVTVAAVVALLAGLLYALLLEYLDTAGRQRGNAAAAVA
ncbi:hypothetical protein [Aquabacterium sp. J223]|uniref:hypothetical protein n=1 Tax=Aquabacterium sp. J223 TaxID=2898431 RepID=UPI0021ADEA25|nr:hypothetical protein [Aquabacterium sp. J223]UUX94808.1 hypothetical protein LRS07_16200 [Aquabacterium sp. J223]